MPTVSPVTDREPVADDWLAAFLIELFFLRELRGQKSSDYMKSAIPDCLFCSSCDQLFLARVTWGRHERRPHG
jgi:hypothetical protein